LAHRLANLQDRGLIERIIRSVTWHYQCGQGHTQGIQHAQHHLELRQIRTVILAVPVAKECCPIGIVVHSHCGTVHANGIGVQVVHAHQPLPQTRFHFLPDLILAQGLQDIGQPIIGEILPTDRVRAQQGQHSHLSDGPRFHFDHAMVGFAEDETQPQASQPANTQALSITVRLNDIIQQGGNTHPPLLMY